MALINWSDAQFSSNIPEIDQQRRRFVDLINHMEQADDEQLPGFFQRLEQLVERIFETEDQLMQQVAYPEREAHVSEHQALMSEVRYLKERVENGLITLGRTYIKARLPGWFRDHSQSMDSELAGLVGEMR